MPVLECTCGMVMSLSVAAPRKTCIRCGRTEFHELDRFDSAAVANEDSLLAPITSRGECPAAADACVDSDPAGQWHAVSATSAHVKFW